MKHYLQTVHDTTFVVAAFSVLMLIVMAVAYVSLYNENVRLRKQVARTSNHPSAVRAQHGLLKLAGISDEDAEAMRQAWRAQHQPLVDYWQPSLLGDDTLRMLAGQ